MLAPLTEAPVEAGSDADNLLLEDRRGEALAPLAAAGVDDLAAAGGGHASAEAVGTDATGGVGLISALHDEGRDINHRTDASSRHEATVTDQRPSPLLFRFGGFRSERDLV